MKTPILVILFFVSVFFLFSCEKENDKITAHFLLNGNAKDSGPNHIHGIVYGARPVADRYGNEQSAYSFDGIDDFIKVPNMGDYLSPNEITISMWVRSDVSVPQCQLYLGSNASRLSISINYFHDGRNTIFWDFGYQNEAYNPPGRLYYRPEPFDNEWHHYVFISSISQQVMSIYKDNILLCSEQDPLQLSTGNSDMDMFIGSGNNILFFHGCIDDIRIYNYVLSEKEVSAL